jgi:hypothetical protein
VFPSDLPGVNPAILNGMLLYYRLMTKWSGLGDSTILSRVGLSHYARGKAMHVDAEVAQENPRVVLGMFLVNSTPASVLFYSGASHSFITFQFGAQHNIPISPMPRHMLVSSPGGN